MKALRVVLAHMRSCAPGMTWILTGSTILLGAVLVMRLWMGIPLHDLTSDPVAVAKLPVYTGFLSQAGALIWAAAAAICWFGAAALAGRPDAQDVRQFLGASGLFTFVLAIDDVFLLHEEVLPSVGVPEAAVVFVYVAGALLYVLRFYSIVLTTQYVLLSIAFASLAISVVLDRFPLPGANPYLLEDAAKLVGIVSWLVYFQGTALSAIRASPRSHSIEACTETGARSLRASGE